jgi:hypothetical protein
MVSLSQTPRPDNASELRWQAPGCTPDSIGPYDIGTPTAARQRASQHVPGAGRANRMWTDLDEMKLLESPTNDRRWL